MLLRSHDSMVTFVLLFSWSCSLLGILWGTKHCYSATTGVSSCSASQMFHCYFFCAYKCGCKEKLSLPSHRRFLGVWLHGEREGYSLPKIVSSLALGSLLVLSIVHFRSKGLTVYVHASIHTCLAIPHFHACWSYLFLAICCREFYYFLCCTVFFSCRLDLC